MVRRLCNLFSRLVSGSNGLSELKAEEIKHLKASQLEIARQFAEESQNTELLAHVKKRKQAIRRADEAGYDVFRGSR